MSTYTSRIHRLPDAKTTQHILPAPQQTPLSSRRVSPLCEGPRVRKRGIYLGTAPDGQPVYLSHRHLRTHLQLIGPTGTGKSKLLLWIYSLLCYTNRPLVVIDPKGSLYIMCRDWALTNGFQKRLVLFDLSGTVLPGYNPLRESSLRLDLQAQWIREAVKSAWGQSTFDQTPQLARMLYMCLYVGSALRLSLLESLDVFRPISTIRERALMRIEDPFVHGALRAFDQLNDRRKEELAASTLARLEAFCCDEIIRQVICSPRSIDLEQLLGERKIILVNFGKYQPLLPDAVKLLGRMFFNDLLAHIYKGHGEGRFDENKPCYIICDEIQNFCTKQVCDALDEGRGIGCHTILAHQHLSQLADEDQSGYLYHSVMADARTKIIFGGLDYKDLEVFANNLVLQHYNPLAIKHIQRTPVFAPVESVRKVPTYSTSKALSQSITENYSEADSISHSVQHSISHGRSVADSLAETEGESEAYTLGRNSSVTESENWGRSEVQSGARTRSQAHTTGTAVGYGRSHGRSNSDGTTNSYGHNSASGWSQSEGRTSAANSGEGQSMLPAEEGILWSEDPEVIGLSAHTGNTEGRSSSSGTSGMYGSAAGHAQSHMRGENFSESDSTSFSSADTAGLSDTEGWSSGWNEGYGVARTDGESEAWTRGTNRSTTRGTTVTNSESVSDGYSDTVGKTFTRGQAFTEGETITHGESVTLSPFYEYRREEIEAPTFLTPEEQKVLVMQRLSRIPKMHFLVKAPESSDLIICAPYVADPSITKRRLAAGLQAVYSALPCYTTVEQQGHDHAANHGNDGDHHGHVHDHVHTARADVAGHADNVVDVEAQEVGMSESVSPASEAEHESALWERWKSMSRGARALPSPTGDDGPDIFWQPAHAPCRSGGQEK
jgi:hypothetical protein